MTDQHSFGVDPITCHAWNKERNQVAISTNNNDVQVYKRKGNDWELSDVLSEHGLRVTSMHWAPNSNRIVSCGADRNAYVWTLEDGKWKPALVLLRINRAATCVKWSPQENKFAVGTGARLIAVCFFDKANDWWISKHIKKPIRSTVTALDWHPNNMLLAAGSTDFKARVFSAYIKDIEDKPSPTPWGSKMPLGQLMAEFSNSNLGGGWVHGVSFSASGNKLCWVGHDSSINIVDATKGSTLAVLKSDFLPFLTVTWVTETSIVAGGYDCCPVLFKLDANNKLTFSSKLDISQKKEKGAASAMRKFQSLDRLARADTNDTSLATAHQNAITHIAIHTGDKNNAQKLSTTGVDGQMVVWDMKSLESLIASMKLG